MKWKELIIGALVTLLVTIVGGVVGWKFTKVPPAPDPAPHIAYQMDTPAKFTSESKSVVFNTVRIGNLGNKVAEEIVLSVEFPDGTEISEFSIVNSSGAAARNNQNELSSEENEKIVQVDSLMPDEVITLSILTNSYEGSPKVTVRYSGGLAEQGPLVKAPNPDAEEPQAKKAALAALILGLLLPIMLYRLKRIMSEFRSLNNSAFMILHQGLIAEATKMLENEINSKGATSFELANLGLSKALSGDFDTATKLYSAAELYSKSKHIKALVAFNRAISSFDANDLTLAKEQFEIASNLYKKRIKEYVEL